MHGKYPTKIQCDPSKMSMKIMENRSIVFTYEVEFVESDVQWSSRWDAYSKLEGAKVHWSSILSTIVFVAFLAGVVFLILSRTVRRDLTRYEAAEARTKDELTGWKFVVGDVFRAGPKQAYASVCAGRRRHPDTWHGGGVHLVRRTGFVSPASGGNLVAGMLLCYIILGVAAGYVAVRIWKTIKVRDHSGWMSVCWRVCCFFPGIAFFVMTVLDIMLSGRQRSTRTISCSAMIVLSLLWFCISVPLILLSGFLGAKAPRIEYPDKTINHIPREVPPQKYSSWLLVLGAGALPFGALFIELFFIMSSIWMGRVYYVFGFLFVVLVLLAVVCAEVSLVLTYVHLCLEDWSWGWKSFFASGSVAIYIFLCSVSYLTFAVQRSHRPVSDVLHLGYSLLIVLATMLATGAVGFISSFWFVHYLFSSVKLD